MLLGSREHASDDVRRAALCTITNANHTNTAGDENPSNKPSLLSSSYQYTGKLDDIDECDAEDPFVRDFIRSRHV